MSLTLFGIKNCDTIKKARKWLEANELDYQFHDYRVDGLEEAKLDSWIEEAGWKTLLNQRSTSWRQLDAAVKENIDATSAKALMLENPTLIKRPVLETGKEILVGFKETTYQAHFQDA